MTAPALVFHQDTHQYLLDGRPVLSVTQILKLAGLSSDFEHVSPLVLERKREIGEAVHMATQYLDEGTLSWSSVDPEVEPYVRAYERFRAETGIVPIYSELRVYHRVHRYAGTLDRIGVVPGTTRAALIDLKTGDPVAAGARFQTAAYLEAVKAMSLPIDGRSLIERWSVELQPTGRYAITKHADPRDFDLFLAAAKIAAFKTWGGSR